MMTFYKQQWGYTIILSGIYNSRFSMASPLAMPHFTLDCVEINGYTIPKDTLILINLWSGSRDRRVWGDNAEEFKPSRFLDTQSQVRKPMESGWGAESQRAWTTADSWRSGRSQNEVRGVRMKWVGSEWSGRSHNDVGGVRMKWVESYDVGRVRAITVLKWTLARRSWFKTVQWLFDDLALEIWKLSSIKMFTEFLCVDKTIFEI